MQCFRTTSRVLTSTLYRPLSTSAIRFPRRTSAWQTAEARRLEDELEETTAQQDSLRPWYQQDPVSLTDDLPSLDTRPPPPAPSDLPSPIARLWDDLVSMPHLDPHSVRVIDTVTNESYADYVCIGTMRAGRERTFRGAADLVKSSRALHAVYEPGRPKPLVRIEGLRPAEPVWVMLDGGPVVVHLMTEAARRTWNLDEVATMPSRDFDQSPPQLANDDGRPVA